MMEKNFKDKIARRVIEYYATTLDALLDGCRSSDTIQKKIVFIELRSRWIGHTLGGERHHLAFFAFKIWRPMWADRPPLLPLCLAA
jgi:hypothetical protein